MFAVCGVLVLSEDAFEVVGILHSQIYTCTSMYYLVKELKLVRRENENWLARFLPLSLRVRVKMTKLRPF